MVCPVYEYKAIKRNVYFPNTTGWYDFYTGKFIAGGTQQSVEAPYTRMPLYVPEGAILPFGPEIQFTDEKKPEYITLFVYGGKNGSFTLYEDEGVNYNYEKGAFAMIDFNYDEGSKTLEIGDRKGSFEGMLQNRKFNVVFINQSSPKAYDPDTKGIEVNYNGTKQSVKL